MAVWPSHSTPQVRNRPQNHGRTWPMMGSTPFIHFMYYFPILGQCCYIAICIHLLLGLGTSTGKSLGNLQPFWKEHLEHPLLQGESSRASGLDRSIWMGRVASDGSSLGLGDPWSDQSDLLGAVWSLDKSSRFIVYS